MTPHRQRVDHDRDGHDHKVIRAAGGVVWRRRADGVVEVVMVHRPTQDDWTLPKGKLEGDERHRDAALREVLEETGLRCELGVRLDDSAYVTPRGEDKTVRWWVMTLVADDGFEPNHEVDAVRWVAVSEADDLASYQTDRDVVHSFVTSGASNGS